MTDIEGQKDQLITHELQRDLIRPANLVRVSNQKLKQSWPEIIEVTLLYFGLNSALVAILYALLFGGLLSILLSFSGKDSNLGTFDIFASTINGLVFLVCFGVFITLSIVVKFWYTAALYESIHQTRQQSSHGVRHAIGLIRILPGLVWVSVLRSSLVIGGLVLFGIPGIFFYLVTSFSSQAYLYERKKGVQALVFSWTLIKGRYSKVLLRLLVPIGILLLIIAALVALLFTKVLTIVISLSFLVAIVWWLFFKKVFAYQLYQDLVVSVRPHDNHSQKPVLIQVVSWLGVVFLAFAFSFIIISIGLAVRHPSPEMFEQERTKLKDLWKQNSDRGQGTSDSRDQYFPAKDQSPITPDFDDNDEPQVQ